MEPSADDRIVSERLELPLLTVEQLDLIAAERPEPVAAALDAQLSSAWLRDVRRLAGFRAQQIRDRPGDRVWTLRPILLREAPRVAIGHINFHGAPDANGVPEIGYALLPEWRGKGYAIEAVRAMFGWATQVHGVQRFRASVAPDNERSLHLIHKLGFTQVGEQWDEEDGLELVHEVSI